MAALGIDFDRLQRLSPEKFGTIFSTLSGTTLITKWRMIDVLHHASKNPALEDVIAQQYTGGSFNRDSYAKYFKMADEFPVSRRKWHISPEFYYTVTGMTDEYGNSCPFVQDNLLQMVVNKIASDEKPEGGIRKWLRDEVKKLNREPVTEVTKLELPITTINGKRYIEADVIPDNVKLVQVKYTVIIEYEQSEIETEAQEMAA